ncbi:MAG TPA: NYN domain-containing protein [Candidatus Binatia bacterium]|nr:NYN domain-containing protein [Candidatus Binatia bacterium]
MPTSSAKKKSATKARSASTRKVAARPSKSAGAAHSVPRPVHRAIFIDVENTSSEVDLMRVVDALKIDRVAQPTELTAAGNWKSVGQRLARRLASLGANLVHSAPATGVRDWSDLWIAVAAGCWLGGAQPGDRLDIVSDDRAFDAVGDAAAARGVVFQRITHRTSSTSSSLAQPPADRAPRRRRRGRAKSSRPAAVSPPNVQPVPSPVPPQHEDAHAASHEQIITTIGRLTGGDSQRWVNLDVLANALKAEGFTRPPGSPRLVTRLRKLKDLEVSPNGMVRVVKLAPDETTGSPIAARQQHSRGTRSRRGRGRGGRVRTAVATRDPGSFDQPQHSDQPGEPPES